MEFQEYNLVFGSGFVTTPIACKIRTGKKGLTMQRERERLR